MMSYYQDLFELGSATSTTTFSTPLTNQQTSLVGQFKNFVER